MRPSGGVTCFAGRLNSRAAQAETSFSTRRPDSGTRENTLLCFLYGPVIHPRDKMKSQGWVARSYLSHQLIAGCQSGQRQNTHAQQQEAGGFRGNVDLEGLGGNRTAGVVRR